MRFMIAVACAVALSVSGVGAQPFAPADVSILLAAPEESNSPVLPLPDSSLSAATAASVAAVVGQAGRVADQGGVRAIDAGLLGAGRKELHVTSIRIDPGAPGLSAAFDAFGRAPQIRLVAQPLTFEDGAPKVSDEAVHLVYTFGTPDPQPNCRFHTTPDIKAFAPVVEELFALKTNLAAVDVTTDGVALGVHPAFSSGVSANQLVAALKAFLQSFATEDRLSAISVAGLPENQPEPWIFVATSRDPQTGAFRPVPGMAIAQTAGAPVSAQMLSFADDFTNGEVLPPGASRNLLPVDCLANFLLSSQPGSSDGVSTTTLFAEGANTPEAAAAIASVVADPARAHFFNTDCLSCHTETRREIDAAADGAAASAAIAEAEGIDPAAMPRGPNDSGREFDKWNVRAFGWYPGFGPAGARAHPTVTRRAARETAEVVTCLNSGAWRDPTRPCVGVTAQAPESPGGTHGAIQGWNEGVRKRFYHTSQGSRLMPAAYFTALQRSDGGGAFASQENLARYGFLASGDDALGLNPLGLPVGFALTGPEPAAEVGLNCAACHSADVVANGQLLRVDGAPAPLDFDRFLADLAETVQATMQVDGDGRPSPALLAFLAAVAQNAPELADPSKALAFAADFVGQAALRHPAHPSGPGRVDALTQIVNALAVSELGVPENLRVPGAPTSYPALWLAPRQEFVQWNLTASDPLGRNIGQAQGVFGRTDLKGPAPFETSAGLPALSSYEDWLKALEPPRWPEDILGPVDTQVAERGRDLFKAKCEGCHNAPPFRETRPEDNLDGETFIQVGAIPLQEAGTDPVYTHSLLGRWVETGHLASMFGNSPTVPAVVYFRDIVGSTTKSLIDKAKEAGDGSFAKPRLRPAGHPDCPEDSRPCAYSIPGKGASLKAGPLLGIWATGPYLHNGSVRTVYELLSRPEERASGFWLGDRSLDAEHLGFANTASEGAFRFDTRVPGNGAQGHVFWETPFNEEEKLALIEYLKDPERFPIER